MSARIEWFEARYTQPALIEHGDDEAVADALDPGEVALTFSGSEVAAVHGTREDIESLVRTLYRKVFRTNPVPRRGEFQFASGAQDLGDGKHGVHTYDADCGEDEYYVEHTVTQDGVIIDVYDVHGEMLHYTDALDWAQVCELAIRRDGARWDRERARREATS